MREGRISIIPIGSLAGATGSRHRHCTCRIVLKGEELCVPAFAAVAAATVPIEIVQRCAHTRVQHHRSHGQRQKSARNLEAITKQAQWQG